MFCSNCGKTLKADAKTCPHCKAIVGESRFDGLPYTSVQVKTKPNEAVCTPGNHIKTSYMGENPELKSDADARTTYRAANEHVYGYDEPAVEEVILNRPESADEAPADEEAPVSFEEPEQAQEAAEEVSYDSEPAPSEDASEENESEEEEAPRAVSRRERRMAESGAKKRTKEDAEDEALDAYYDNMDDSRREELYRTLDTDEKKAKKKPVSRKKTDEYSLSDDDMRLIEIEEIAIDENEQRELRKALSEYKESGRYDMAEQPRKAKPARRKAAPTEEEVYEEVPAEEKKRKPFLNLKFKKRRVEEDFDALTPDDFELEEDENSFNLNYLPEMADETTLEEYPEEAYGDETFAEDEAFEDIPTDEEIEQAYGRPRKKLNVSPKALTIIKYAGALLLIVAVAVGVITGLSNIADKTKTAPIDGVTYELYNEGIDLIRYRASTGYQNEALAGYTAGDTSGMVAITARISSDLDMLDTLMPENPSPNDARFIHALKTIQTNINDMITIDLMALSDTSKTAAQKLAESDANRAIVEGKVTALTAATSTAQLDAIIKGAGVEIIVQATDTPAAQATATPIPYTTLSTGSEGNAVRELQQRLSDLGYLTSEVDGDFGRKTKTAVQLFQQTAGLEVTGIADANTQIALFAEDAPRKN